MPDYTPVFNPGHEVTLTTSAVVTGGQLLTVTASGVVGPAGAGAPVVGVASTDAPAGGRVAVFLHGHVHESTAAGTIAAGAGVTSAAGGQVAATGTGNSRLGIALTSGVATGLVRWVNLGVRVVAAKSTGATAGTPGTFTPANSTVPANFADLAGVTANPTTLWTVGQRVVLGDGTSAYWNGTAWAVGTAPA